MKLKLKANLGDDWPRDKDGNYYQQDETYDFDDATAEKLLRAGLAEPPNAKHATATTAEEEGEEEESPVHDLPAHEAIEKVKGMRKVERLQEIASNDQRPTVKAAAERRLQEIGQ